MIATAITRANAFASVPAASGQPWLQLVSHLDPKYGGLSSAVPALASAVAESSRFPLSIAAFCADKEHFVPPTADPAAVHHLPLGRTRFRNSVDAKWVLRELVQSAAGLHLHGLWQQATAEGARTAREWRKPYVVSAHGMLEPWALRNKQFRKALYAALFERENLRRARCLHALTRAEADDYRRFGLRNPIAIIPNGVSIPSDVSAESFLHKFPHVRGKRLVLFMARLHPKKGLDVLCHAWSKLCSQWPDAHLVVAGPDTENTRSRIEELARSLGINRDLTFTGMLEGDLKWSALAAASCFVLPSYSEGLSVSVLEAMGMGVPVVVTEQCHLPEVAAHECGWTIQPDADQLASALTELLRSPASFLDRLSANARRLIQDRYSWARVGGEMAAVYGWVAGGSLPTHIDLDLRGIS